MSAAAAFEAGPRGRCRYCAGRREPGAHGPSNPASVRGGPRCAPGTRLTCWRCCDPAPAAGRPTTGTPSSRSGQASPRWKPGCRVKKPRLAPSPAPLPNGSTGSWCNRRQAGASAAGGSEHPHDKLLPFGTEQTGQAWLHSRCWHHWHASRKAEAVATLSSFEILT